MYVSILILKILLFVYAKYYLHKQIIQWNHDSQQQYNQYKQIFAIYGEKWLLEITNKITVRLLHDIESF